MRPNYLIPNWPAPKQIKAYTTTRGGGASTGCFASYNLAHHVGDDPQHVQENRAQLQHTLALPSQPVWLTQVHGNHVVIADTVASEVTADASYTQQARIVCAILTADCLPILVTNTYGTEVAAIHAGWRSLTQCIIQQTLAKFKAPPEELLAWLGPAIGPKVYEVGDEVRTAAIVQLPAATAAFQPTRPGHWLADLYVLARQVLYAHGVQHIYGGTFCTYADSKQFFSYRRDQTSGRMASLIWMDDI